MKEKTKQDLIQFLKENIDVFAWSHEDMPGIDPNVITHRLNMYPSYKQVRQKKGSLLLRETMLSRKRSRRTTTQFIQEVYYPDWLANVVMVKKANGKWRM